MFSPSFRSVLLKSIGLALLLIVVVGIGLHQVLTWFAEAGEVWADGALGPNAHLPLYLLAKLMSFAAVLGIIVGSVFLMPAVTALVASFFVDDIAAAVEHAHYPRERSGRALPPSLAVMQGAKTALLAALVYLFALPFLLVAGLGVVLFFLATAFLLGREYFLLAAMRFHPPGDARHLLKLHQGMIFLGGMFIAAFVSIPVLSLATPLFGTAFMVHLHKRLCPASSALSVA